MNRFLPTLAIASVLGIVLWLVAAHLRLAPGVALGQIRQVVDDGRVPHGAILLSRSSDSWPGYTADGKLDRPTQWRDLAPMATPRSGTAAAIVSTRLFVVGGWNGSDTYIEENAEYDATTNTWLERSPMPAGKNHHCLVEANGLLYAIGGGESSADFRYDPSSDTWQSITALPSYRSYAAAALLGDQIYVIGGYQTRWDATGTIQKYDPTTDSWSLAQPMPTPRLGHGVAAVAGKLYAIGGYNGQALAANEVYDPATDSWTARAPMPTPRYSATVVAINQSIFVLGGYNRPSPDYGPGFVLATVEEYRADLDEWVSLAPMPSPAVAAAGVAMGSEVILSGGLDDQGGAPHFLDRVEAVTPLQTLYLHRRQ